jgi:hypothetical protein
MAGSYAGTTATDLINVYDPTFWAQESLAQLFPMLRMTGLMYRSFEGTVAAQGDLVNTRMPGTFVASDVNPDSFASNKPQAENVAIKLDKWKQVVFEIGDREQSLSLKGLQDEFAFPAAFALAAAVEDAAIDLHKDVYQTIGVAGTTPSTVASLGTDIKQAFDVAQVPDQGRQVVLGPQAVNKFNQVFYQDYVSGSTDQQTTGQLRPKFGMLYSDSNKLPNHVNGTAFTSATPLVNGNQTANGGAVIRPGQLPGAGTVNLKALATGGTINQGDVFSIGGQTYTSTTTQTITGTTATVAITPILQTSPADGDSVTVTANHAINLAFHNQAFALVSRPLAVPNAPGANVSVVNFNGIGLRSTVWYSPKDVRTYVRLDLLFGVRTLDARKAFRVLG